MKEKEDEFNNFIQEYYTKFVTESGIHTKNEKRKMIEDFCKKFCILSMDKEEYTGNISVVEMNTKQKIIGSMKKINDTNGVYSINKDALLDKFSLGSDNSNEAFKGFYQLLINVNHEFEHYIQLTEIRKLNILTDKKSLGDKITFSYENICKNFDKAFYKSQKGNYLNYLTEGEARREGNLKAFTQIMESKVPINEENIKFMIDKMQNSVKRDNIEYNNINSTIEDRNGNRNDITRKYVELEVTNSPKKMLEKYPCLQLEFNDDGHRKGLEEILDENGNLYKKINSMSIKDAKSLSDNLNIGYFKIMINTLKNMNKEDIEDTCHRLPKFKLVETIEFIKYFKECELNNRKQNIGKYYDIIKKFGLEKYTNRQIFLNARQMYSNKAKEKYSFDIRTQENYAEIEDEDTKFLDEFRKEIEEMDFTPYVKSEEIKNNDLRKKRYKEQKRELLKERKKIKRKINKSIRKEKIKELFPNILNYKTKDNEKEYYEYKINDEEKDFNESLEVAESERYLKKVKEREVSNVKNEEEINHEMEIKD